MPRPPPPIDLDEAAFRADEAGVSPRAFVEIVMREKLLLGRNPDKALPERRNLSKVRSLRLRPGNFVDVNGTTLADAKIDWPGMVSALRSLGAVGAERLWVHPPVIITDTMLAAAKRPPGTIVSGSPPPPRQASPQWWMGAYFESSQPVPDAGLRQAPESEIDKAITAAYDNAEKAGTRPPNIIEIAEPVQALLKAQNYKASKRQIRKLADQEPHKSRRGAVGPHFRK